jgi:hypothetical protein
VDRELFLPLLGKHREDSRPAINKTSQMPKLCAGNSPATSKMTTN